MSELIDDKVDKFHEDLIRRLYTKKELVAVVIGIMLFAFWYVAATYREYDEWRYEDTWAIIRRPSTTRGLPQCKFPIR